MSSSFGRRDGFSPLSQQGARGEAGTRRTEAAFATLLMVIGLMVLILGFSAGIGPSSAASGGGGSLNPSATPTPAVTPTPTYVPAGYSWLSRTTPTTNSNAFYGITYGNGKFVAVAAGNCGTNCAMTSADGVTWTLQTNPSAPNGAFNDVAYGSGVFVAISSGGAFRSMNSTDGVTWVLNTALPTSNNWLGLTYDGPTGNKRFVAVAASGSSGAAVSTDGGATWAVQTTPNPTGPSASRWFDVAYGGLPGSEVFAAVALGCTNDCIMTSSLGTAPWTLQTTPVSGNQWIAITFGGPTGGKVFVALAVTCTNQCVMTSPDGTTWTLQTTPVNGNNTWNDVVYGGSPGYEVFLAVAQGPTSASSLVMTSSNGINWTLGASSPNAEWHAVAVGQMLNGNALFASVAGNCGGSCVMTSA